MAINPDDIFMSVSKDQIIDYIKTNDIDFRITTNPVDQSYKQLAIEFYFNQIMMMTKVHHLQQRLSESVTVKRLSYNREVALKNLEKEIKTGEFQSPTRMISAKPGPKIDFVNGKEIRSLYRSKSDSRLFHGQLFLRKMMPPEELRISCKMCSIRIHIMF